MLLTPIIKRKKGATKNTIQEPFPVGANVRGIFTGISVEVNDAANIIQIYENGCYGKGSKSRGAPKAVTKGFDGDESLTLELEESCFLSYFLGILCIENLKGNEIQWSEFINEATKVNSNFLECLAAYVYLKAKGWIVKSGIKFGGNFLIYKKGPRFNHASFIIFVRPAIDSCIVTKDLKGIQRVAETSDKDILLLQVSKPKELALNTIMDIRNFSVSEIVLRRFNSTSFVQSQKLTK